ncbi:salivary selenoprotein precursor-like protein [Euroglyphus maynei]|uniref:Salivary selenoprotein-like protein n=1 Tax=Euroglyphus maynei TaxID=6958 RepID=A0A1Y3BAW0_EURMA|nr:salivary selenoprotein precursor-like protein [Euroglyphus maynei]
MNPAYLFGCIISVIVASIVGEKLTDDECHQIGYNPSELYCNRCNELTKFELDSLKDSCMKCCRQDDSNSKKYSFARLEYCECNIANFPQIKGMCVKVF